MNSRARRPSIPLLLAALIPAACGGGGGGANAFRDPRPSTLTVDFPPLRCVVDATEIIVHGTASDPDGVREVQVDGVAAIGISSNGVLQWIATLTLPAGQSTHAIDVVDANGRRSAATTLTIESAPLASNLFGVAIDEKAGLAIVSSFNSLELSTVELAGTVRRPFSDATRGGGDDFEEPPRLMKFDPDAGEVFVALDDALMAVDRKGQRRIVSGRGVGAGPQFIDCRDVVLDTALDRAFVIDQLAGDSLSAAVLVIRLADGSRSILSDAQVGSGPKLSAPLGIDRVPGSDVVVIITSSSLIAVDMNDGSRTIVSDSGRGSGAPFQDPFSVAVLADGSAALVTDDDALLAVDLVTGDRTVVSGRGIGTGPALSEAVGCALDESNHRALVVNGLTSALLAVDLGTGDRIDLTIGLTGKGDVSLTSSDAAVPASDGTGWFAFGLDATRSQCVARIDRVTGDRTLVSGDSRGVGPALFVPLDLALDEANGTLLVANLDDNVLAIDPESGDRRVFSGGTVGAGPAFLPDVTALTLLSERRLAFVCDRDRTAGVGRVLALDLDTGDRELLSDGSRGSGPTLVRPVAVVADADRNELLVLDATLDALLAIDLITGDREIVSDDVRGSGPGLNLATHLLHDAANDRVIASQTVAGSTFLLAIDRTTGDRNIIFDTTFSFGTKLFGGGEVLPGSNPGTLICLSSGSGALFELDLAPFTGVVLSQ